MGLLISMNDEQRAISYFTRNHGIFTITETLEGSWEILVRGRRITKKNKKEALEAIIDLYHRYKKDDDFVYPLRTKKAIHLRGWLSTEIYYYPLLEG